MAAPSFLKNTLRALGTVGGAGGAAGAEGLNYLLDQLFGGEEMAKQQQQKFPESKQYSLLSPQQQQLQNLAIQQAMSGLRQQPQAPDISALESQARRGFQEQTIPSIAERFVGMQSGSGFQSALGQAGASLEDQLAQLRYGSQLQQQGIQQNRLSELLRLGLSPQQQTVLNPQIPEPINRAPGIGEQALGAGAQYLPDIIDAILKQLGGMGGGQNKMGQSSPLSFENLYQNNPAFSPGGPGYNPYSQYMQPQRL